MAFWRALVLSTAFGLLTAPAAWAAASANAANEEKEAKQEAKEAEKAEKKASKAPEIDSAGLGGAVALLVGGTFLFAGARRRRDS